LIVKVCMNDERDPDDFLLTTNILHRQFADKKL
jgi:hypothetical protein